MENTAVAWKGHGQTPFGYNYNNKEKKLVINKEQAKRLREIYAFTLNEKFPSAHKVAAYLNKKGIKSSRGKLWSYKTVRYLFEETKLWFYAGYKNDQRGEWEPIINKEIAQRIINKKVFIATSSRPRTRVYLLTGLDLLKCGLCGYSIKAARSVNPHTENLYYRCASKTYRDKDACDSKVWPMKEIDDLVLNDLTIHITHAPEKIETYTKQFEAKRNKEAEQSINHISYKINKLIQAQNSSTSSKQIEQLNKYISEKLQEKNHLLTLKQESFDTNLLFSKAKHIKSFPIQEQRGLLKRFIKRITLSKDKVIIDYNFCFAPNKYSQTLSIK